MVTKEQIEQLTSVSLQLLEEERTLLDSLQQQLRTERNCLEQNDPASIERVTQEKKQTLLLVAQNHQRHQSLYESLQMKPGRESMLKVFELFPPQARKHAYFLLEELEQKLDDCKETNQLNGVLLSALMQQTGRLSDIIFDQHPSGTLYNQKGETGSNSTGKLSAKI